MSAGCGDEGVSRICIGFKSNRTSSPKTIALRTIKSQFRAKGDEAHRRPSQSAAAQPKSMPK
jgi:hypothetical protein